MTVTNQENTVVYTGNGATTEFDFSFRVDDADELKVILYTISTGLEEELDPSDYSVAGIGETAGGTVTYAPGGSPMASTHKLILRRVVPLKQDIDITAQDGFNPEIVEEQLDRMVMMIQQISEKVDRAATLSAANAVDSLEDLLAATLAIADLEDEINTLAGIAANVTTVSGISANVTTVAGIAAHVTTLAGIAANISTVAGIAANVTTVAVIASAVSTLAGIAAAITTVAGLETEVQTVAGLETELESIYAALANIATVVANLANINTVAGIDTEITILAGLNTELAAIYAALADIQAAAADLPSLAAKLNIDGSNVGDSAARAAFRSSIGAELEPGFIAFYAASSPPSGWLEADGSTVSRTTYAALFAAIGTTWGAGDGATTFKLPDLRGVFPRGWDDGRGIDTGRAFGSSQTDAFQGHRHHFGNGGTGDGSSMPNGAGAYLVPWKNVAGSGQAGEWSVQTDGTNGTPRTANETRPYNIALLGCIKY